MNNIEQALKFFDMYGQSVNFSYMGKSTFSTTCGGLVSIIIIGLLLYYSITLILLMVFHNEPFSFTTLLYLNPAPEINVKMDRQSFFKNFSVPEANFNDPKNSFMQISIGLMDERLIKFIPIDTRYFNIYMFMSQKTTINGTENYEQVAVFFDLCTRFSNFTEEYQIWRLNETYCAFTDIKVMGSSIDANNSFLNIDINRCQNNTLIHVDQSESEGYQNFLSTFEQSEQINKQNTTNIDIDKKSRSLNQDQKNEDNCKSDSLCKKHRDKFKTSPNKDFNIQKEVKTKNDHQQKHSKRYLIDIDDPTPEAFRNLNKRTEKIYRYVQKYPNIKILENPAGGHLIENLYNNTGQSVKKYNKVICKPKNEIDELLKNIQIYAFFTKQYINVTDFNEPIKQTMDYETFFTSYKVKKTNTFAISLKKLTTYTSVLPYFLDKQNITNYALDMTSIGGNFADTDDSYLFRLFITSGNTHSHTERNYINLLDIMGLVGGLAKIFLGVGALLTAQIIEILLNESMINEFYSVINPKYNKALEMPFDMFILKMAKYYELSDDKETIPNEFEIIESKPVLRKFFTINLIHKLYEYQKEQQKRENNNLPKNACSNNPEEMDDKKKACYEIIYEISKYKIYDKMFFTPWELLQVLICKSCKGCLNKSLKNKYEVYIKACKKLDTDTDFPKLLSSVREFQRINKTFLDEGQFNLFNAMVNKPLLIEDIENKKNANAQKKQEDQKKIENEKKAQKIKEDQKKTGANNNKNDLKYVEEENTYNNMHALKKALKKMMYIKRTDIDIDRILLENIGVDENKTKTLINQLFGFDEQSNVIENFNNIEQTENENKKSDVLITNKILEDIKSQEFKNERYK